MKLKFLCPQCGSLTDYFTCIYHETREYTAFPDPQDVANVGYTSSDVINVELMAVKHHCGFYTETYAPEDFLVVVTKDKIIPYGSYWDEHPDEFKSWAKMVVV